MKINQLIEKITNLDQKIIIIIMGLLIYLTNFNNTNLFLLTNILITTFVLAVFDVFLKNILLFNENDEYYTFIVNNVITILCINLMVYLIKGNYEKLSINNFFNLAFSCFFYEMIVFKLYNYNGLCNNKLRTMTKTIMRLATIHILGTYLNGDDFDKKWFDYSFSQLANFSLFNIIFE